MTPVRRATARVVAVAPGDVVLLLRYLGRDGNGYWITPGGGIRPEETTAQAAARELREETGLRVDPRDLGPVVATSSGQWSDGGTVYDAHDSFFFWRALHTEVDTAGQERLEHSLCTGWRWWEAPAMTASTEPILPDGLADLVVRLLAGERLGVPVRLTWR